MSREYKLDLKRQGLFRTKGFIGGQWVSASAGRPPFECIGPLYALRFLPSLTCLEQTQALANHSPSASR